MRSIFFDIEAGGLKAPFDQVICCAFKEPLKKEYVISRRIEDVNDHRLLLEIRDELNNYDILIGYYSLGYDKPFLNARLLKNGEVPLPRKLHIDCYRLAKKIFGYSLHSRRLVSICELLGIKGKSRVEPKLWEDFKYGKLEGELKLKALNEIIEHCSKDVVTLEKAFNICFKYAVVGIGLA